MLQSWASRTLSTPTAAAVAVEDFQSDSPCQKPEDKKRKAEESPQDEQDPEKVNVPLGKDVKRARGGSHQVLGALKKIGSHIGTLSKFKKASSLLRQLLDQELLTAEQGGECFKAIARSMSNPRQSQDPTLRKEYWKLITCACKHSSLFDAQQRAQLEVYQIWAVLMNEMHTDDSFAFNRVLKKVQELIEALPEVGSVEEAAHKAWEQAPKAKEVPEATNEEESVDPFDLDDILDTGEAKEDCVWAPEVCSIARREALLDCLEEAKGKYRLAWACTSVDILITAADKCKSKFCTSQKRAIEDLRKFVMQQKAERKQGPSEKEIRRDITTFEEARSTWSKTHVSHRGKVGASGDRKTEMWLG